MKKFFAGITTAIVAVGLVIVGAVAPASAHSNTVDGSYICNTQTGTFDITWTVQNSQVVETEEITASTNTTAVPVGTTLAGNQETKTFYQNGVGPGTYSLQVTGLWSNGQTNTSNNKVLEVSGDCQVPDVETVPALLFTAASCESAETVSTPADTAQVTWGPISNPTTSTYSVVATAGTGFYFANVPGAVISNGGKTATFTGTLDDKTDCPTPVPALVFTAASCTSAETVAPPADTPNVTWSTDQDPAPSSYSIVATAGTGYVFDPAQVGDAVLTDAGKTATFTGTLDPANFCPVPITGVPTTLQTATCEDATNLLTLPLVSGGTWTVTNGASTWTGSEYTGAGTLGFGEYTITLGDLSATDLFTVTPGTWTWTVVDPVTLECEPPTLPSVEPLVTQVQNCTTSTYTLSNDLDDPEAIIWTVNGEPAEEGTYDTDPDSTVAITATAAEGYGLSGSETGELSWMLEFTAPEDCLPTLALTGASASLGMMLAGGMLFLGMAGIYARRRYGVRAE